MLPLVLAACDSVADAGASSATSVPPAAASPDGPPADVAPPLPGGPRPAASASASAKAVSKPSPAAQACAPSLAYRGRLDERTSSALERCENLKTGLSKASKSCGLGERVASDRTRFIDAVPPFDDATRKRVREVFARGKALGRKRDVFGLVGDSITVSEDFLAPFSANKRRRFVLDEVTRDALSLANGTTVIDFFQRGIGESRAGETCDPFAGFRAAKVGASADWALADAPASAAEELLRRLNPAYVVITFGANDAASHNGSPEKIADDFEANLLKIVHFFEQRGVVAILSGEMRHGDSPGVKACPRDDHRNDWRIAVCTNATVARAAEIACRDRVPFIDLRHALDRATNFGLGPDAVHLSTYQNGAGVLDERGLDCGNNIRNFVTLLALKRVLEVVDEPPASR